MSTVTQFVAKTAAVPAVFDRNTKKAVGEAAYVTKLAIVAAARGRGWPVKPWMVHYRLADTPAGPVARLKGRGGKIYMFEYGAKSHEIGGAFGKGTTKYGRRRKSRASPVLAGGLDHPVVGPIDHPGFQGRPFWDQGVRAAQPAVGKILQAATKVSMAEVFGR